MKAGHLRMHRSVNIQSMRYGFAMAQLPGIPGLPEDVTELNMSQNAMAELLDVFECLVFFFLWSFRFVEIHFCLQ